MRVKVLRRRDRSCEPAWESFSYDGPLDISVAGLLDYINFHDDIVNEEGKKTDRISWECSCLQGVCGSCAMVICGVPALACETFLRDLVRGHKEVTIEPLRKFPVIRDLMVDRSVIQENLKKANVYIEEYKPSEGGSHRQEYLAAKCLKCGLCLEVCPSYVNGSSFYGAIFANDCYLVSSRNAEKGREVKKLYQEHFGNACSKALSCMDVCPMNIPIIASMAKMNRG